MNQQTIPPRKRETSAILQSLGSGVVPRVGLSHIVVGREREIRQILNELTPLREGGAGSKIVAGGFGSGKTFMLRLTRAMALQERFVVADADFSVERRLTGDAYGIALYRELMKNLATVTREENAIETVIERWLSDIQTSAMRTYGLTRADYSNPQFVQDVQMQAERVFKELEQLAGGFAFREVLKIYYEAYAQGDDDKRRAAVRWLRGEFNSRTEARQQLGVRDIIDDENWYDHLKLLARFVAHAGYSGFVVTLDEAVNLYKISHAQSRQKNYEALLKVFNDVNQGGAQHLYVIVGATVETVTDERRGFFSYDALKGRLKKNAFETDAHKDLSQPVLELAALRPEHQYVLLQKLRDIYAMHYGGPEPCSDAEIQKFLLDILNRPGAAKFITPRDIVKRFLDALNILRQNPTMPRERIFEAASIRPVEPSETADTSQVEEPASAGAPSRGVRDRFRHSG